jgi:hypothetical protein
VTEDDEDGIDLGALSEAWNGVQGKPLPRPRTFKYVAVGDVVTRRVQGDVVLVKLNVDAVSDDLIHCGSWKFDRLTGAEVDEDLGWGPNGTGSYLRWEGRG